MEIVDTKSASRAATTKLMLRVMRPYQWVKNLTCLSGLLFSGGMLRSDMLISAVLAYFAFCSMASAIYIFNDYFDRHVDRLNPRTADRPLASGALPAWAALLGIGVLFTGATVISLFLNLPCTIVILAYALMNVGYSLQLKRTVIADVMCIAFGFVLRVLFGVYAVNAIPSPWIVLCMFFLALFLGFGKRKAEMTAMGGDATAARFVLQKYTPAYIDLLFGITATITILTYMLFTLAPHHDPTMVITVFPVVYCVFRYAHHVIALGTGQVPESLFIEDRMLWFGVATWVLLCIFILYFGLSFIEIPRSLPPTSIQ